MAFPKDIFGRISKLTRPKTREDRSSKDERQLLESKVVAEYKETARPTIPIHAAAYEGNNERLKLLLEEEINVDTSDPKKHGVTALMIAASKGHFDVTRTILLNGANVHQLDTYFRTALDYAVYQGSILVVYYLIRWGSNPNHTDRTGLAPIHYAAKLGNLTMVKLLVECGAKKSIDSQKLGTPLKVAQDKGHKEIVDYLTATTDTSRTSLSPSSESYGKGKRDSLSVSPVNRSTCPGRRGSDTRSPGHSPRSPGHSPRSPGHSPRSPISRSPVNRSPVSPSAPPDYESVGIYLEGAVGGYEFAGNARPSAPSYHEVIDEPSAPSYDEVFDDNISGYGSGAAGLSVPGVLPPPPTYEDVISSNGQYDVAPPPYHAASMYTENNRRQSGQSDFSSDDFTKEFHDLMNFARDIKADMQADVVPVNISLAEVLVRTHVDRRRPIEERFYLFKENGRKTYQESSRTNIDDVNEKMTLAEQEEYMLLVMYTGYMFEYDVCLKHYDICKQLEEEIDQLAEQQVLIISVNLEDTSTNLSEERLLMGKFDISLNELETKHQKLDKEVKNLDKLKEWNYMSHPVKIDVNHFLMRRAVKFTKASGKVREVRRFYLEKELKIEMMCKDSDSDNQDHITDGWFKTAEIGDQRNIQMYLHCGIDVNVTNETGMTALHIAAFKGYTEFVHELLTSGADLNIKSNEGTTVIYEAVKMGRTEVVKELLTRCTEIKDFKKGYVGRSPVQLACIRGHWEIVKLFISKTVMNVNVRFSTGFTPLGYAAEQGNLQMVKYLISKGADIELAKNKKGNFPYKDDIVQELKGHQRRTQSQNESSTSESTTDFLRAVKVGDMNKIWSFLRGNININASNPNGLNALHLAAKFDLAIVRVLMQHGAKVNAATKKGNTPLHIAALAGQIDTVKYLAEKNAKINVQSDCGFTPLYMAAQEGHTDVVKYLLQNGADATLSTEDGFTPLAVALQQGHQDTIDILLHINDYSGEEPRQESPDQISIPKPPVDLSYRGHLSRKHEWVNTFQRAASRVWVNVFAVLDNHAMSFYEPSDFSEKTGIPMDKVPYEPRFILNNAKVGPAVDYKKKKYVFFVRLENGGSFLFKADSEETMDEWILKIQRVIGHQHGF